MGWLWNFCKGKTSPKIAHEFEAIPDLARAAVREGNVINRP